LLELTKDKTRLQANISPGPDSGLSASNGISGLQWVYSIHRYDAHVDLYIDTDQENGERNLEILERFLEHRNVIEEKFGGALEWQRLEGKRACRIKYEILSGGWEDEEEWPDVRNAMVDAMIRMEAAFRPHLEKLGGERRGKRFPSLDFWNLFWIHHTPGQLFSKFPWDIPTSSATCFSKPMSREGKKWMHTKPNKSPSGFSSWMVSPMGCEPSACQTGRVGLSWGIAFTLIEPYNPAPNWTAPGCTFCFVETGKLPRSCMLVKRILSEIG